MDTEFTCLLWSLTVWENITAPILVAVICIFFIIHAFMVYTSAEHCDVWSQCHNHTYLFLHIFVSKLSMYLGPHKQEQSASHITRCSLLLANGKHKTEKNTISHIHWQLQQELLPQTDDMSPTSTSITSVWFIFKTPIIHKQAILIHYCSLLLACTLTLGTNLRTELAAIQHKMPL